MSDTKTNKLKQLWEIMSVHSENHMKPGQNTWLFNVKVGFSISMSHFRIYYQLIVGIVYEPLTLIFLKQLVPKPRVIICVCV
jgi:hypothetical protein